MSDVDGAVRRVGVGYDALGNAALVTSYSAASGGSVVNQVKRSYDGLGQLMSEAQSHSGAVTAATPVVGYGYDFQASAGGANRSRLASMTYPDGRVVGYSYGSAGGLDDRIGRLSALTDSGVTLEGYTYLGLGAVVARSHPQAGADLTYVKRPGEPDGDAGDSVVGLDRFGRVADQRWISASGADLDRHTYGYDRGGNRSYRDDRVNPGFGEVYSYDGLSQVTGFARGTLDAAKTGLTGAASRSQGYGFDALGNFTSVTTDGVAQARSANQQNEVTGVAGAVTPVFDAAGNMTGDEAGRKFTYDAWNRLVAVKSGGGVLLKSYAYDGTGRRVTETPAGAAAAELYYSSGWQVLEERVGGVAKASYVWSPVYVDALVARDRDADGSSTNGREERLYALADANYNVTALVGVDGVVKERYAYDAFGQVTVMGGDYGARSVSGYGWVVGFQGMRYDSISGLNGSRFRPGYSPTLGRWVQGDPIGFAGGDSNLYRFVAGSPTNLVDPSGLQPPQGEPEPGTPEWLMGRQGPMTAGSGIPQANKDWFNQVRDDAPAVMANGAFEIGSVIIPIPGGNLVGIAAKKGWKIARGGTGKIIGFIKSNGSHATNKEVACLAKDALPGLHGTASHPGMVELSNRTKSNKAFQSIFKDGVNNVEFVYDPNTRTFLASQGLKNRGGMLSPHERLAAGLPPGNGGPNSIVGGHVNRGLDGKLSFNEHSGHFGQNWTQDIRKQFVEDLKKLTGSDVSHTPW